MSRILIQVQQEPGEKLQTFLNNYNDPSLDYRAFGLILCDVARHVAKAFHVKESDVWEWIDRERHRPTTKITGMNIENA